MTDDTTSVYYEVVLDGDQYDHEQFREEVHELGGEISREVEVAEVDDE
jgi:hypothetical protein